MQMPSRRGRVIEAAYVYTHPNPAIEALVDDSMGTFRPCSPNLPKSRVKLDVLLAIDVAKFERLKECFCKIGNPAVSFNTP